WTLAGNGRQPRRRSKFSALCADVNVGGEKASEREDCHDHMLCKSSSARRNHRSAFRRAVASGCPATTAPAESSPTMGAGPTGDSNWAQPRAHRAAPTTNNRRQIADREVESTHGL